MILTNPTVIGIDWQDLTEWVNIACWFNLFFRVYVFEYLYSIF